MDQLQLMQQDFKEVHRYIEQERIEKKKVSELKSSISKIEEERKQLHIKIDRLHNTVSSVVTCVSITQM